MKRWVTVMEKYAPAMEITEQAIADVYFEECVEHSMWHGHSREEAELIERANLGYFAGYYDDAVRERVERLFRCEHPVFGGIRERGPVTSEEALRLGLERGQKQK